jgi:aldehyde dehydrogenase (NAD+)
MAVRSSLDDTRSPTVFDYSDLVADVRASFKTGKTKDLKWRRQQLEGILRMLAENHERITAAVRADLGGPKVRGIAEIAGMATSAQMCLDNLDSWAADESVKHENPLVGKSYVRKEPKGTVLLIAPWNYPIQLIIRPLAYIIAAGNCCVVKPSELAPHSTALVEELVPKYLDPTCFRVVTGAVPETTALLKCKWDHIIYTGNGAVAQIVLQAAALHLTPCTLELGGKSPVIIDESADLKIAAKRVAGGKWLNQGQTCIAPDYVLVHESVKDLFLQESLAVLDRGFGTDGTKATQTKKGWGTIIHPRHAGRLQGLLDSSSGEVVRGGSGNIDVEAKYVPPTILVGPDFNDRVMKEEIFGPILVVQTFETIDEAVAKVHQVCDSPLALYVFSEKQDNIDHILHNTQSGGVCINDTISHVANESLPFGGVGESGMGYYSSKWGFDEFTHFRAVFRRDTTWQKGSTLGPPYPGEQLYDMAIKMFVTGFVSPMQKKVLQAIGVGLLGFLVVRPRL